MSGKPRGVPQLPPYFRVPLNSLGRKHGYKIRTGRWPNERKDSHPSVVVLQVILIIRESVRVLQLLYSAFNAAKSLGARLSRFLKDNFMFRHVMPKGMLLLLPSNVGFVVVAVLLVMLVLVVSVS